MEFVILGAGPGLPNLENHLSALYVSANGKKLLFDCGDGSSHLLLKKGLSGNELDAIAISHYHPDHICGLYMVLQMLYLEGRTKPLDIFLPERPVAFIESLNMFYTFDQKFNFKVHYRVVEEIELFYEGVSAALTDHLIGYEQIIKQLNLLNPMQSYSFRISEAEGDLVYTSDLTTVECIQPFIQGCHTIIVDGMHPEANSVLKLQYSDIKRIIITHGRSPELTAKMQEMSIDRFELANEGIVYRI
ncbi:MAG: ribonuclease Z [Candidatus Cloacimonetes bacterium]|nr:ribonuclease Z [Candidatus Cloacimonadota bacterium]